MIRRHAERFERFINVSYLSPQLKLEDHLREHSLHYKNQVMKKWVWVNTC